VLEASSTDGFSAFYCKLCSEVRIGIMPGITGNWQVSGRSDVEDFEEVVKLDAEYIKDWSVWSDLKILFKTVAVVLKRDGSK
jgi:lipopolysaccharide/colanic/teichoic acid biosynthesis glycosyltransferase